MEHLSELRRRVAIAACIFTLATLVGLWIAPGLLGVMMKPLQSVPTPPIKEPILVLKAAADGSLTATLNNGAPLTSESLALLSTDSIMLEVPGAPSPVTLGRAARPINNLYFLSPAEPFMLLMKASLLFGCLAGIPALIWQGWLFAAPGLRRNERNLIKPALIWSLLLFPLGAGFAWAIIGFALNILINFGTQIPGLQPNLAAAQYVGFVLTLMIVFGIVFEFPLVMVLLGYLGLVKSSMLVKRRRECIVVLAIVAGALTPPDPVTMIAMLIPLLLLFELSIILMRTMERKREKAA